MAPNSSPLLSYPAGVAEGPDGNLYISSQGTDTIVQYNMATHVLSPFLSYTVLDPIAAANGDETDGYPYFAPAGLTFDSSGNLFVSLNGGRSAGPTGAVISFATVETANGLAYANSYTTVDTGLIQPTFITFGTAPGDTDSLYVSSTAIIEVDDQEEGVGEVTKIVDASTTPNPEIFVSPGAGGLNTASGLEWGPNGNLYVVDLAATSPDGQGNVLEFDSNGNYVKIFTQSQGFTPGSLDYQFPSDLVFDGAGHLITANLGGGYPPAQGGGLYEYNLDGTFAQSLVNSGQFPTYAGSGFSGISASALTLISAPPPPSLFAASYFDNAVYEFNAVTGALEATLVPPSPSPSPPTYPPPDSPAMLYGPAGLTVGPDGNLYISSQNSDAILEYNFATQSLSTFIDTTALDGIAGENGDEVFAPAGLCFDSSGNLFVSLNGGRDAYYGRRGDRVQYHGCERQPGLCRDIQYSCDWIDPADRHDIRDWSRRYR